MSKILLLPLDERPCNYEYPLHIGVPREFLMLPPQNLLGSKKVPGNFSALKSWLLDNVSNFSHIILSIDQLVYGGLIPSRLHYLSKAELAERLQLVSELKKINPNLKIFGFVMIMRNPFYSSSDEEPDYYEYDGSNIYKSGYYQDKKAKTGALTADEENDYQMALSKLHKENLDDYLSRRAINIEIVKQAILLRKNGILDYLVIPQDDSSPFGYTKRDQETIAGCIAEKGISGIDIYPGADEVGLVLLARAVQDIYGKKTSFEPVFACEKGKYEIPPFEDRPFYQSLNSQIQASGSTVAKNSSKAIKLFINIASKFLDKNNPEYHQCYEVDRNLPNFISKIKTAISQNEKVAIADISMPNGGDQELVAGLEAEELSLKVYSYAGWNTSSNTLGTAIAQAIIYDTFRNEEQNRYFLLHRYYEDVGYMSYTRKYVTDNFLPGLGLDYFNAGGKKTVVSYLVKETLEKFMQERFPNIASHINSIDVSQPWARMFETDIKLSLASATKVCVDIGGTFIKGGVVTNGKIIRFFKSPTNGSVGREAILASLYSVIDTLMNDDVTGISISTAGDIDAEKGLCTYASDNLKGWTGLNLKETLESRYHLLTFVDNDAYCHLNAEMRNIKSGKNITLLTFGTGVGGASLIDGALDRSATTKWGYRVIVPEGRYLEGAKTKGVAEAYLGSPYLALMMRKYDTKFSFDNLFDLYGKNDPDAITVLKEYGHHLNLLLRLINTEIRPDVIILGGGLVSNHPVIESLIEPDIKNYQFAQFGNDAGIIGAYYLPFGENTK